MVTGSVTFTLLNISIRIQAYILMTIQLYVKDVICYDSSTFMSHQLKVLCKNASKPLFYS